VGHIEKKPFDKKWKKNGKKWEGKWQTETDPNIPALDPHMETMRIWAFEMGQWAEQVTKDWDEVEQLSARMDDVTQQLREMGDALGKLRDDVNRLSPVKRPT
jgi:hypothetical protein